MRYNLGGNSTSSTIDADRTPTDCESHGADMTSGTRTPVSQSADNERMVLQQRACEHSRGTLLSTTRNLTVQRKTRETHL